MSQAENKIKWTDAQELAISTHGKTLLVSASAGSGKTATLTERIIRSLTDESQPKDISKMLISTFTRASAADLKLKISKALTKALKNDPENVHLSKQLIDLGSAQISTIDSFLYDVLKKNFGALSLKKLPRLVEEKEIEILQAELMKDVIEDFYTKRENFGQFMDAFTASGKDEFAIEAFIDIYEKLRKKEDGISVLLQYKEELTKGADRPFFETLHGKIIKDELESFIGFAFKMTADSYSSISLNPIADEKYGEAFKTDLLFYKRAIDLCNSNDYNGLKNHFESFNKLNLKSLSEKNLPDKELLDRFRKMGKMRGDTWKEATKKKEKYLHLSQNAISVSYKQNASLCGTLYDILNEFDERLNNEKESRAICGFDDITLYVYKLFVKDGKPTELAKEYASRFTDIYVDEYQDVNEIQDALFKAISSPTNRFMVGDIKQSIYGFRDADPTIFARYKKDFPIINSNATDRDEYSIFMSENFRCDRSVIDFSNTVSSFLFSNREKSIEYTKDDDLKFSKNPSECCSPAIPVKIAITGVDMGKDDKDGHRIPEVKFIAKEIDRLVKTERLANGDPIQYKDIAIIARGQKLFPNIAAELSSYGIPSAMAKGKNPLENPEVLLILAFLSTIDNPEKDVSLAGTLRSPFYNFTFDEIYEIKSAQDDSYSLYDALINASKLDTELGEKCKSFLSELDYWRNAAISLPCYKLIKKIYNELSVLSYGENDSKHLFWLYESALKFESNGFKGLYGFINYIESIIEMDAKIEPPPIVTDPNCVSIMTIHASKGLEFPICFVVNCESKFNTSDTAKKIVYDPHVGIGFKPSDDSGFAEYPSIPHASVSTKIKNTQKEEEMRLLYVAMTRARERLYIVAELKDPDALTEKLENECSFNAEYSIMKSSNYISWILASLKSSEHPECYSIEYFGDINSSFSHTEDNIEPKVASVSEEIVAKLKERFDYKYPYEHLSNLPAKLAVSRLYPTVLDDIGGDGADLDEIDIDKILERDFTFPSSLNETEKISAADKGTATHTFLQFCNFENVITHGVTKELTFLTEKRFISRSTADIVNKKHLERFFESSLFNRIRTAKRIWREQRFNIFLPANEFTGIEEKAKSLMGETIAVQGVIDIFFEDADGNIVLCDYKTDYLSAEEIRDPILAKEKLSSRHKEQLRYYKKAITEILGRSPDEVMIYSLPLGEHITIELD